jgi:hypothetical protein
VVEAEQVSEHSLRGRDERGGGVEGRGSSEQLMAKSVFLDGIKPPLFRLVK